MLENLFSETEIEIERKEKGNNCPIVAMSELKPKPLRLENTGNTCFINSILQCLFSCDDFVSELSKSSSAYSSLVLYMKRIFRGSRKSNPNALRSCVRIGGSSSGSSSGESQEDAHEFLLLLLDKLHLDTHMKVKFKKDSNPAGIKAWKAFCENSYSDLVTNLFYGQYKFTFECNNCIHEHNTYEPFGDQGLDISNNTGGQNKVGTVQDLLNALKEPEYISGYTCDYCHKRDIDLTKTCRVTKYPKVLLIHLKRFQSTGQRIIKNHTLVEVSRKAWFFNTRYTLFAICNHYGSIDSGHYTATVSLRDRTGSSGSDRQWFECDDESVTPILKSQVDIGNAYILFYKKSP